MIQNQFVRLTGEQPIMIIGEKPGKQRPGSAPLAFRGNWTGDFIEDLIKDKSDIILTNANNNPSEVTPLRAKYNLIELINQYKPCKIICLGNHAAKIMEQVNDYYIRSNYQLKDFHIKFFAHPSFIRRFHYSTLDDYRQQLLKVLE